MLRGSFLLVGFALLGLMIVGCGGLSGSGGIPFREQVAEAQKQTDAESRVRRLIDIGQQQGTAYDRVGAAETLELARADCEAIADVEVRTDMLTQLARTQAGIGDRAAARQAIESAKATIAGVKQEETKILLLTRVARAQGAVGDYSHGSVTLKLTKALAAEVEDVQGRTLSYCAIAGAYHAFHQSDDRDRVFDTAIRYVRSVADPKKHCRALAEIAAKQAELNDIGAATDSFNQALAMADEIENPYFRAYVLSEVAERLSNAGFRIKAHRVLARAEIAAEMVPEQDLQLQSIQKVRSLMDKLPKKQG